MTSLQIDEGGIPSLEGKIAIITGGASGIGLAAAQLLLRKDATVHILDVSDHGEDMRGMHFHKCDASSWTELRAIFADLPRVDLAFANAAVTEHRNYFEDSFDEEGLLAEPDQSFQSIFDVNLKGVMYFVKLAWSTMRKNGTRGSIVITTSATAYAPEQSLPVYAAAKAGLVGFIRALRSVLPEDGITINGVAPAATITRLLPADLAAPIIAMGLPVSTAEHVGLALVHAATAQQSQRVAAYGKENDSVKGAPNGRWNGRVILTLGDTFTELEEFTSNLRPQWLGLENEQLTRQQQAATDFRASVA